MITYDKGWWGNRVLFRAYGSAFPRAMPGACLSAVIAAMVSALCDTPSWNVFQNTYPLQLFTFIVGFMVIFRNNLSYGRYWEGRTRLQQMTARLSDAARGAINFDRPAPGGSAAAEEVEEHKWFCDTLVHLVSLFHGVALATLRGDFDMENIVVHDSCARAPPDNHRSHTKAAGADARAMAEGPQHKTPPQDGVGAPGEGCADDLKNGCGRGEAEAEASRRPSPFSRAWAGHKNLLDFFVLRTSPEHAHHIHRSLQLPVIGGFTQAEGAALGAFTTSGGAGTPTPDLDLGIHGFLLENGTYAPAPTERVQAIASWMHQCLCERIHAGGIAMVPPLRALVFASLTDAFIAFEHCQKLTDTPFPFPWVQAVNISLAVFTLGAPFAVTAFVNNTFVAILLTFLAVATHATLNEVASDIEDPFHYDPNQLPLPQMQYKLNERLLAVLNADRPIAFTDFGDLTGPGNTVTVRSAPQAPPPPGAPEADNGISPTSAAGGAAAPRFGGGAFASIAQAAFTAAASANPDSSAAAPARTFMMRSAAAGRRWQGADIRSFKSAAPAQPLPLSESRRLGTAAAAVVMSSNSGGAPQQDSVAAHRRESPRAPAGGASPAVSADHHTGSSDTYLGMPPSLIADSVKLGEPRLQAGGHTQAAAGADERGSRPRGWGVVRLAVRPDKSGPAAGPAPAESAAAAAQAVAPEGTGLQGGSQGHGKLGMGAQMTHANPDGGLDSTAAVAGAQGSAGDRPSDAVHGKAHLWRSAASKQSTASARQQHEGTGDSTRALA